MNYEKKLRARSDSAQYNVNFINHDTIKTDYRGAARESYNFFNKKYI